MFPQPHQGDLWQQCYTNLISHLAKKMFAHQEACVVYLFLQNHGGVHLITCDYIWLSKWHIYFFHCSDHCFFFCLRWLNPSVKGAILIFRQVFSGTLGAALSHPADTLKTRLQAGVAWPLMVVWWLFVLNDGVFYPKWTGLETIQVVGLIRGLVLFFAIRGSEDLDLYADIRRCLTSFLLQFLSGQPGRGLWICEQSQDSASRHQDTNHDPTQKL